jgi:EF hand
MNLPRLTVLGACALALLVAGTTVVRADSDDDDDRRARPRVEHFVRLFDTDKDNKVSIDEIAAEHGRLFGAVDVDGDKLLTVEEFRRRGRLFQSLRTTTLFDLLDANGDQKLSPDEISAPSRRWFTRYDVNGDGMMDADEVAKARDRRYGAKRKHRGKRSEMRGEMRGPAPKASGGVR